MKITMTPSQLYCCNTLESLAKLLRQRNLIITAFCRIESMPPGTKFLHTTVAATSENVQKRVIPIDEHSFMLGTREEDGEGMNLFAPRLTVGVRACGTGLRAWPSEAPWSSRHVSSSDDRWRIALCPGDLYLGKTPEHLSEVLRTKNLELVAFRQPEKGEMFLTTPDMVNVTELTYNFGSRPSIYSRLIVRPSDGDTYDVDPFKVWE